MLALSALSGAFAAMYAPSAVILDRTGKAAASPATAGVFYTVRSWSVN